MKTMSIKTIKSKTSKAAKKMDQYLTKRHYKVLGLASLTCFVLGYFTHKQ